MHTAEIERNALELAIGYNDLQAVTTTEARLIILRNRCKVQFKLEACTHAKEVAGQALLSVNTDLYLCREYRKNVDHILLEERNSTQVELAGNKGMDVGKWVTLYGELFEEYWNK